MNKEIDYSRVKNIFIEEGGKKIQGEYVIHDGMITVIYNLTEKTTQLGGSSPDSLAGILLRELVSENADL
jgi:hypothetical protein